MNNYYLKFLLFFTLLLFETNLFAQEKYSITYNNNDVYNDTNNITGEKQDKDSKKNELELKNLHEGDDNDVNSKIIMQNQEIKTDQNNIKKDQIEPKDGLKLKSKSQNQIIDFEAERKKHISDEEWLKKKGNIYDQKGSGFKENNESKSEKKNQSDLDNAVNKKINNDFNLKIISETSDKNSRAQAELERRVNELSKIKLTKEQILAFGHPSPSINLKTNWKIQRTPPNISQKFYNKENQHLPPVLFPYEYLTQSLKYINDEKNKDNFKSLIDAIGDPSVIDENGNTFLMHAVFNKNYNMLFYLINRGVALDKKNIYGIAPIHLSTYLDDHISSVALIEGGSDPNLKDENENTPLMYAALSGDVSLVKRIVDLGGNIDEKNKHGLEVIDFAYHSQNIEIVNYLMKKGATILLHQDVLSKKEADIEYMQINRGSELIDQYKKNLVKQEYFYYSR